MLKNPTIFSKAKVTRVEPQKVHFKGSFAQSKSEQMSQSL